MSKNFCCNDDFNANDLFDAFDGFLYDVFIAETIKGAQPQTIQQLLDKYNTYATEGNVPTLEGGLDHLPEFDCSDFNLNGLFDAFDGYLYLVFIAETVKGAQPQTIQQLLDKYNTYASEGNVPVLEGGLDHLPRLASEAVCATATLELAYDGNCMDIWDTNYHPVSGYIKARFTRNLFTNDNVLLENGYGNESYTLSGPDADKLEISLSQFTGVGTLQFKSTYDWRATENLGKSYNVIVSVTFNNSNYPSQTFGASYDYTFVVKKGIEIEHTATFGTYESRPWYINGFNPNISKQRTFYTNSNKITSYNVTTGIPERTPQLYISSVQIKTYDSSDGKFKELFVYSPEPIYSPQPMQVVIQNPVGGLKIDEQNNLVFDKPPVPFSSYRVTVAVLDGCGIVGARHTYDDFTNYTYLHFNVVQVPCCDEKSNEYQIVSGNTNSAEDSLSAEWFSNFGGKLCYNEIEEGTPKSYLTYIQDSQEPVGTINITGDFVSDNEIYYTDTNEICYSALPTIENDNEVYRFVNSDSLLGTIEIEYLHSSNIRSSLPMMEIGENGITIEYGGYFHRVYNINDIDGKLKNFETMLSKDIPKRIKIHGDLKSIGYREDKRYYHTTDNVTKSNYIDGNSRITYFKIKGMSSLTNVESMLEGCANLTKENLDLSEFDTSNITNMNSMFKDCTSLSELNLSNFNVNSVTSMENMFDGCSSLSAVDFTGWCVTNINSEPTNFASNSLFTERPNWGQPC